MKLKRFPYKGKTYTKAELHKMFPHIKPSSLDARLHKGLTVEEAIAPQTWEEHIPEEFRYKELIISFETPIAVLPEMQPTLHKRYIAVPHQENKRGKMFFIIKLRDDKTLIVYPGEFKIHGIANKCSDQECAPPYGEKTDCEMYDAGFCIGLPISKGGT